MVCAVVHVFSNPAVGQRTGPLQLRQMIGDAGLAHPENLLQFGHGKFLLFEEKQQAQASWVRQQPEQING
jgi:hypothetical protein